MTQEAINTIMMERGFARLLATSEKVGENGDIEFSMIFVHSENPDAPLTVPHYTCEVWPESGEFRCRYGIPSSVDQVITPRCSAFFSGEHFFKIVHHFENEIAVLHNYLK